MIFHSISYRAIHKWEIHCNNFFVIVDTFGRVDDELMWRTMTAFKSCFYRIDDTDEANLTKAPKDGTLNGTEYSNEDIAALKQSKAWKQFAKYLRKVIFAGDKQQQKLSEFITDYQFCEDLQGRRIFFPKTVDAKI